MNSDDLEVGCTYVVDVGNAVPILLLYTGPSQWGETLSSFRDHRGAVWTLEASRVLALYRRASVLPRWLTRALVAARARPWVATAGLGLLAALTLWWTR